MADDVWVLALPASLLVDVGMLGSVWLGEIAGRAIEIRWPQYDPGRGLVIGPECSVALPSGLGWGEQLDIDDSMFVVDHVLLVITAEDALLRREAFMGLLAEFRARWMSWTGVITGQPTSFRWAPISALRNREGIYLVDSSSPGRIDLIESTTTTTWVGSPGKDVGAVILDRDLHDIAWQRTTVSEEPPFAVGMFKAAREAFQMRQLRVGVLELGTALEVLFREEYQELCDKPRERISLGGLVGELSKLMVLNGGEDSPLSALVELRNDLVHRSYEPFYKGSCVRAFDVGLEQFRRRYPDLFPEGSRLIGVL